MEKKCGGFGGGKKRENNVGGKAGEQKDSLHGTPHQVYSSRRWVP